MPDFLPVLFAVAAAGALIWAGLRIWDTRRRRRAMENHARRVQAELAARMDASAAELRDSAERLRSIIDSAVDGIIVIDAAGHIESFNRGAERLFGYPESEVVGRNVSMLMPSPQHEEHDQYLARFLETGTAKIIGIGREVSGRRRDGTTFPLRLSVAAMSIGGVRKFTGILHDVSERVALENQLRSSEARWRAVIESAVDGIIVIDAHGRIEAFNTAAERLFGYAERDVMGQNVHMLMPSPYHEEHDGYLSRYLATGRKKIIGTGRQVTGLRRDGTTFPLHLSVGELVVGGARRFTGIVHDLSARLQVEGQLREQTAMARIGEMAAVIAHEVKNPLAGVRGAIQVIGSRLPPDSKDGRIIDEIVSRVDALDALMKDLLLFARPPSPRMVPVDLAKLAESTIELLREDPALRGIEVHVDGAPPPMQADPDLLRIVLLNLLVNGAQAMQGRGSLHIGVARDDGSCAVSVRDEGPGIPSEIREKIFTPFFTTKARGSGLGLPTAKRLVEAHGGEIVVESPAGGGTTFTIRLPVEQSRS